MKKVAVINFSGNVGKSSIARYLLAPRIGCEVVSIESINDAGAANKSKAVLRGQEIEELREFLISSESLVVDIGASNVEDFVGGLSEYSDGIDDFDYFIVPTVPALKQQEDTVATITQLVDMGIPNEKIIVIFNQFDKKGGPLNRQYKKIFSANSKNTLCDINENAVVPTHRFFEAFQHEERSFDEVVEDDVNYRELIGETDNEELKSEYVRKIGMKSLAMGITKDLDKVYSAIA